MKICLMTSVYALSNKDRNGSFLVESNRYLRQQGHEVHVFAPSYEGRKSHTVQGVPVHRFRYFFKRWENLTHMQGAPNRIRNPLYLAIAGFYILFGLWGAVRFCRRHKFDVIHVHWPFPHGIWGWAASKLTGTPMVLTFHGAEILLSKRFFFVKTFLRHALRHARAVICNSNYTKAEVAKLTDKPIQVIPFGCTIEPKPLRKDPDRPVKEILFAGRHIARKGLDVLLRALPSIAQRVPVHLHVVGDGDRTAEWKQLTAKLGLQDQVTFHGIVSNEELERRYASADVFVLPAIVDDRGDTEGLGVVLVEALSFRTPVVASAVGGIGDVIKHEETGLLVPEKDPVALAAAVTRVLLNRHLAERLTFWGLEHATAYFNWGRITDQLQATYLDCLPEGQAPQRTPEAAGPRPRKTKVRTVVVETCAVRPTASACREDEAAVALGGLAGASPSQEATVAVAPARPWSGWTLFFLLLAGSLTGLFGLVVVPAFGSPTSRVYASSLGYPAVMRRLERPIRVDTETVRNRDMVRMFSAEGQLCFLNEIPVKSEVPGIVTEVLVEAGQPVRKGDVLLRLNNGGSVSRQAQLTCELRLWELKQARSQLERDRRLYQLKSLAPALLEQSELAVKHAQLACELAEETYRNSLRSRSTTVTQGGETTASMAAAPHEVSIHATADGVLYQRHVQQGENLVQMDKPLLLIGDRLVFRAAFDQRYAAALRAGDKGKIYLRACPGTPLEGEVVRISPRVNTDEGKAQNQQPPYAFHVWIALSATAGLDSTLIAGMNGHCIFERPFTAPAVSESTLMRYSGRQGTVLIVDAEQRLQVKRIAYSLADAGWVAIESGLAEGDRVVLRGQVALVPGDKVEPQDQ